jgi:hypothetical protein
MSEIEIINDSGRRRRWSAAEKLRIVEETMFEGESISAGFLRWTWLTKPRASMKASFCLER